MRVPAGLGIFLSDMGLLGMGYVLYRAALAYSWNAVLMYYFIPYIVRPHRPVSRSPSLPQCHSAALQPLVRPHVLTAHTSSLTKSHTAPRIGEAPSAPRPPAH